MDLQSNFVANMHAAHGQIGKVWLAQLDAHLEDLAKEWDFQFIQQLPNLTYSFVGLVRLNSTGEKVILKTTPGEQIISEMRCLQCFPNAAPKIYFFEEKKKAFLMEYLQPGYSLKNLVQAGDDESATRVICQTILALQSQQQNKFLFKHLSDLVKDLSLLQGHVANFVLSKGESLFYDLTSDRSHDVILHGDLHHDNIIYHNSSWKVIDPHGYIGDPVAEVGVMIRNPFDCFPKNKSLHTVIESRLKILTEELPFDAQRIKAWAFCMTLLSAAWNVEDFGTTAKFEIEIASVIDRIKI